MKSPALASLCVLCAHPFLAAGETPFTIPTFHCAGLYWSPPGGAAGKEVLVRYRRSGETGWKQGLPMRYNPIPKTDNDFDYDLCNGRVAQNQEAHGVRGEPIYAPGAGFDPATQSGRFQLSPDSPGAAAGQPIPNFSDGYTGKAPDVGAHQRGAPPIQYGVRAQQP